MQPTVHISIYLDTRRAKSNGKFPVKLRVFTSFPRRQKLYGTAFELTQSEFHSVWETSKPKSEFKELRWKLQELEKEANKIASGIPHFTFEDFERKMLRGTIDTTNLIAHYQETVKRLYEEKRFGTESSYYLAMKSLIEFQCHRTYKGSLPDNFPDCREFRDIKMEYFIDIREVTPNWLNQFEQYMLRVKGRSLTTVGIYLRTLRAIFNTVVESGELEKEFYPFGKRKYQIPATRGVKKALSRDEISVLYNAKAKTEYQEEARAYWFFSYASNGMNIKDIAYLRFKDIDGDRIVFYREKTKTTTKTDLVPITAYLTDKTKSIIKKYGNRNTDPNQFVFPIINNAMSPEEQFRRIRNHVKFINTHLKKLAESEGLTTKVSVYWARHSFSTHSIRLGKSIEFVGEALGHTDVKTTQAYFAGFEDEEKKGFVESLMDF